MNRLGIMQGRLSPMVGDQIQAFPEGTWEGEFALAQDCGYSLIEWVVDSREWAKNPLLSSEGRRRIRVLSEATGIGVPAVCVDLFMDYGLLDNDHARRSVSREVLDKLLVACSDVGISQIEIPMIGDMGLSAPGKTDQMVALLREVAPIAEEKQVALLLELDLPPLRVKEFIDRVPSPTVQLNYDCGNSAYWGFCPTEEFDLYGDRVGNVHIKDCTPADYSVPLGTGDVDFDALFSRLARMDYRGDFILQAARGDDNVGLAKAYAAFSEALIGRYLHGS
jgi:L-ribulose-5-phosphate 3-epimerase